MRYSKFDLGHYGCIQPRNKDGTSLNATGLSELLILEDIAGKWAWDHEDKDREATDVRISEICDTVGGTGIGGPCKTICFPQTSGNKRIPLDALKTALAQIVEEVGLDIDLDAPFLSKTSLNWIIHANSVIVCFVSVLNDITAGLPRALRD
ncbi:hypothetical protein DL96DRAFT_1561994 [Flagelloscypha sp. PMI_526]|nr:hypothetical protein DL96DRAFT_1561994 [Flagelloscypha sp. PMI_526]